MSVCAVCSSSAPHKCARCKCVFYCSPAHQKEDWPAHKVQCPRLRAQEAFERLAQETHDKERLLQRITICLAENGHHKEVGVMVQLNKAFWNDEQIWDAFKDVPGPGERTRLLYASSRGLFDRVKWLLARGARPNGSTKIGDTALMGACHHGSLRVVRELCGQGANVNTASNEDGSTPLTVACGFGLLEVVRELLKNGADVNAALTYNGVTPLIFASQNGHLEVVRELIAGGACVNSVTMDSGCSALFIASQNGYLEIVRELIKEGAHLNAAKKKDGSTALLIASLNGHLEVARLLLQKGADKSVSTGMGCTAFSAASGPHKAALQALLKP